MEGTNVYSAQWFRFFHVGIPVGRTERETAFLARVCPRPDFTCVLDLCCGMGRHARALAALGYGVTGVERDADAVTAARAQAAGPTYVQADVREYQPPAGAFDAVVVMSQSFGYFDAATNGRLLGMWAGALRPGGRVVLDLWNPAFFLPRQGQRTFDLPGGTVRETTRVERGRLFSRLDYPNGGHDAFEFQTFSEEEIVRFAAPYGLALAVACTDFDPSQPPSADNPRVQFVLTHE